MAREQKVPLLTVVIPTRHRNDLLAICLERLAPGQQTLSGDRYEVFVTDDGRETTAEAMISERFPWAKWIAGPAHGPAANRNNGALHGTAPWLIFTDDDCIPTPDWLKSYADAITEDASAKGKPCDIYEGRTTCEAGVRSPVQHAPLNEDGGWLWSCNIAVRRDVYEHLGGFDEEFPFAHMEDVDFRERARGQGFSERFVPTATVDHPPRPDNLGERVAPTHESEFMFFFKAGFRAPFRLRHIRRVASLRIRKYLRFRGHPEAGKLLRSLWVESLHILRHGAEWERKYRARYDGITIPYPPDIAKRFHYRL